MTVKMVQVERFYLAPKGPDKNKFSVSGELFFRQATCLRGGRAGRGAGRTHSRTTQPIPQRSLAEKESYQMGKLFFSGP